MKYAYIAYFGKSEVIVNEQPKPERKNWAVDKDFYYIKELNEWQSNCKTIPIAQGHDIKFKVAAIKINSKIDALTNFEDAVKSGIQIPSELVRFESKCKEYSDICKIFGKCNWDECKGVETAFFVDKEQETNEAEKTYTFKEMIDFVKWYSGMKQESIVKAWNRYQVEK